MKNPELTKESVIASIEAFVNAVDCATYINAARHDCENDSAEQTNKCSHSLHNVAHQLAAGMIKELETNKAVNDGMSALMVINEMRREVIEDISNPETTENQKSTSAYIYHLISDYLRGMEIMHNAIVMV